MEELRRIRREQRLSQRALAEKAGVVKSTISLAETGKLRPRVETLEKLAGALGVEVGDFFPKAQGPLPLDFEQRATPIENFEDRVQDLSLDSLNQLGRELAAEHREATEARDWGRAGDLYARRVILWERVKALDPPLCEITYRPDEPPEIVFFRPPTEAEETELREKFGEYVAVEELITVA